MEKELQNQLPISDTRASILTHLLSENLTAIEFEQKLGINESAIRRHLDTLEQKGYVEHSFEKASRGRPKKIYRLTSSGSELFPQKTHQLFVLLAEELKEKRGEARLEDLLIGVAKRFAKQFSEAGNQKSKEDQLKSFVNSLEKFGFFPLLSKESGFYQIKYRNCVFGNVSEKFSGKLCRMHREIVRQVISGCKVTQEKSKARGDDFCVHKIELEV